MKEISFTRSAAKTLRTIPANQALKIKAKIVEYTIDPSSQANNVKKLRGIEGFRLRVGDWRVIFDEGVAVIAILKIGLRGGIYD